MKYLKRSIIGIILIQALVVHAQQYEYIFTKQDIPTSIINDILWLDSNLYIATNKGAFKLEKDTFQQIAYEKVNSICSMDNKYLYLATYEATVLVYQNDKCFDRINVENELGKKMISASTVDLNNLYLAAEGKLVIKNIHSKRILHKNKKIKSQIRSILINKDDLLIGTNKGLLHENFTTKKKRKPLFEDNIYTIKKSPFQEIWVLSRTNRLLPSILYSKNLSDWKKLHLPKEVDRTIIFRDLEFTSDRGVWLITNNELWFAKNNELKKEYTFPKEMYAFNKIQMVNDSTFWISSEVAGLYKIEKKQIPSLIVNFKKILTNNSNKSIVLSNIFFTKDTVTFTKESEALANRYSKEIAHYLLENRSTKIQIIGHTDIGQSEQSENFLLNLSINRAEIIANLIKDNLPIREHYRITTVGKGNRQPILEKGGAVNRRVEIRIL